MRGRTFRIPPEFLNTLTADALDVFRRLRGVRDPDFGAVSGWVGRSEGSASQPEIEAYHALEIVPGVSPSGIATIYRFHQPRLTGLFCVSARCL